MSRIDTVSTEIYKFAELSDESKEKVIEKLYSINVDFEWWDFTYDDAARVGITIKAFDLDRGSYCEGDIYDFEETAEKIIANHGKDCETYKTASQYIIDKCKLVEKFSDGVQLDIVTEDNEYDFDTECDELEDDYKKSIFEDYRVILQKEFEYLTSEAAIIETINANDYEFTADGDIY